MEYFKYLSDEGFRPRIVKDENRFGEPVERVEIDYYLDGVKYDSLFKLYPRIHENGTLESEDTEFSVFISFRNGFMSLIDDGVVGLVGALDSIDMFFSANKEGIINVLVYLIPFINEVPDKAETLGTGMIMTKLKELYKEHPWILLPGYNMIYFGTTFSEIKNMSNENVLKNIIKEDYDV